jgi:phosphatidylglycerophosphate synthase
MLDARLRRHIDPPLNAMGKALAGWGISANMITLTGGGVGIAAGVAIASQNYMLGLALILFSRLLDGLDGAVARATEKTDFGGYLDIVADFAFYIAVPLGFGLADPANLPFALILIASFTLTGISFLAFAVAAANRSLTTEAHGKKSFFYSTGIAEGTETIIAFVLMCLFPGSFWLIASVYCGICVLTVVQRTVLAWRTFD